MGVGETGAETLPSRPPSSGAGLGVAYFLLARIGRKTHLGQKRKESLEPATSLLSSLGSEWEKKKRERRRKRKGQRGKGGNTEQGKKSGHCRPRRWYQCQEKKRQLVVDVRNEDTDVMRSTRNGVMSGVSLPTKTGIRMYQH